MRKLLYIMPMLAMIVACDHTKKSTDNTTNTTTHTTVADKKVGPEFDATSAYMYIDKQVAFGPRVPGTPAHKETADWLQAELALHVDTVILQSTQLTLGDKKTKVPCYNIMGQINPSASKRILLLAHWDTRPWADFDVKDTDQPILGADDGGSGVGVLMELARVIKANPLKSDVGIDILFVDVEDYAKPEWGQNVYALGSQYFAKNPPIKGYSAQAGILLDMVGGANARFAIEYNSQLFAKEVVAAVWSAASDIGYGNYFVYENGMSVEDDHLPINNFLKIPTIDIINQPKNSRTGFVHHWHTHADNMSNIDVNTLKAVGQTLVQYIYSL